MQFSTLAFSALSIAAPLVRPPLVMITKANTNNHPAATTVHVVKVGNANGTLAYSPNSIAAAVGDMVQFQFAPANHTVTQSTFDQPCQPIALHSNITGIYSGFMPVKATATETPTYTILVNSTTPMWIYCSQGKHCQAGMTMVINVNSKANASRTLENYQLAAAKATANLPGIAVSNGTAGEVAASGDSGSSGSSGTSTATSSSASSSSTSSTAGSSATSVKPSQALTLGGLLALGMALFL